MVPPPVTVVVSWYTLRAKVAGAQGGMFTIHMRNESRKIDESIDEVLTIATQELRLATRASRSVVEILPSTDQPARTGNGEGVKA